MMRQFFKWQVIITLFWIACFIVSAASLQDSQTGFRNITITSVDLVAGIAGTANQVTVADDGDGTVTLSTPQNTHTGATPGFTGLTLSGLTASRLMASSAGKAAVSTDLVSWVAGTADEITVTDAADGTIALSIPNNTRYFTNLVSNLADSSASGTVTIFSDHDGTGNKSYHSVSSGDAAQAGVIVKEWIVPEFWSAWVGISIWTQSNDFANCTFVVTLEDGSGNVDSTISGSDIAPTGDDAWEETVLVPGDAVTPGETIRLIFTATNADADDTSWLATDVQISYTASQ